MTTEERQDLLILTVKIESQVKLVGEEINKLDNLFAQSRLLRPIPSPQQEEFGQKFQKLSNDATCMCLLPGFKT